MMTGPDKMDLVLRIHETPLKAAFCITGGGAQAISDLLAVPGASSTVMEVMVPYTSVSMARYLQLTPEKHCAERTARQMAMQAFLRAHRYEQQMQSEGDMPATESMPAGISCTASLATNRPKKGPHRAHLALQTIDRTMSWSIHLEKNVRTRLEEEEIVCKSIINLLAQASKISDQLMIGLGARDHFHERLTLAPPAWQSLYFGELQAVENVDGSIRRIRTMGDEKAPEGALPRGLFPGAFHPMHHGHRRMMAIARERLGDAVALEMSVRNVDKALMDYARMEEVLTQLEEKESLWLTNAARFDEKSQLFPGATFIIGMDTLLRIASPKYYGGSEEAAQAVFERFADRGTRFLVFARRIEGEIRSFPEEGIPEALASLCEGIPASSFCEDISSTEIRRGHDASSF